MSIHALAISLGIKPDRIQVSDRIQRLPTDAHPHKRNGAVFWDGRKGWAFNWETDTRIHWLDTPESKWTEQDKQEWKARRERERRDREIRQRGAANRAEEMLATASVGVHGYFANKGFPKERGCVLPDGALFIPMRDALSNALIGGQVIRLVGGEWDKKMLAGQRAKGAAFRMGPAKPSTRILVEGYVTGLSVAAAVAQLHLSAQVVVCFSSGNLEHVARLLGGDLRVFADNDKSGTGQAAAEATGAPWTMAPIVGWDANDFHCYSGLLALSGLVLALLKR